MNIIHGMPFGKMLIKIYGIYIVRIYHTLRCFHSNYLSTRNSAYINNERVYIYDNLYHIGQLWWHSKCALISSNTMGMAYNVLINFCAQCSVRYTFDQELHKYSQNRHYITQYVKKKEICQRPPGGGKISTADFSRT